MKLITIVFLVLLASACGKKEEPPRAVDPQGVDTQGVRIMNSNQIFRDEATGCEYVANPSGSGITPRLSALGTPICGKQ